MHGIHIVAGIAPCNGIGAERIMDGGALLLREADCKIGQQRWDHAIAP